MLRTTLVTIAYSPGLQATLLFSHSRLFQSWIWILIAIESLRFRDPWCPLTYPQLLCRSLLPPHPAVSLSLLTPVSLTSVASTPCNPITPSTIRPYNLPNVTISRCTIGGPILLTMAMLIIVWILRIWILRLVFCSRQWASCRLHYPLPSSNRRTKKLRHCLLIVVRRIQRLESATTEWTKWRRTSNMSIYSC